MKVTGEFLVKEKEAEGKKVKSYKNLILDNFLDHLMGKNAYKWFDGRYVWEIHLGTSDIPAEPDQTKLQGAEIAREEIQIFDAVGYTPGEYKGYAIRRHRATFPADATKVGLVKEIVIDTSYSNVAASRVVFPEPIDKHEFKELEIVWILTLFSEGIFSGTIANATKDGTADVDWELCISDRMLTQTHLGGQGASPLRVLKIGDSNEQSDPIEQWDLKGNSLYYNYDAATFFKEEPYQQGTFKRKTRIELEVDQANVDIAEMIVARTSNYYPNRESEQRPLFRLTFDPPLEKDEDHRLYIDFEFSLQRGATTTSGTEMAGMGMSVSGINWEPAGA